MSNAHLTAAKKCGMKRFKAPTRLVLMMLADRADEKTGYCWGGHSKLMFETGYSKDAIRQSMKELEAAGVLERKVGNSITHSVSEFWVKLDVLVDMGKECLVSKGYANTVHQGTPIQHRGYANGVQMVRQYSTDGTPMAYRGYASSVPYPSLTPPLSLIDPSSNPAASVEGGSENEQVKENPITEPTTPLSDVNQFIEWWNDMPWVQPYTQSQSIDAGIKSFVAKPEWQQTMHSLVKAYQNSTFLQSGGRNGLNTLGWVLRPNNLQKVLAGDFRNKDGVSRDTRGPQIMSSPATLKTKGFGVLEY